MFSHEIHRVDCKTRQNYLHCKNLKETDMRNPETIQQQVFAGVDLNGYEAANFHYTPWGNYLYAGEPGSELRQVVLFHATDQVGDITLRSREEALALSWRKNARGPGLYGGNTPQAAASSLVQPQDTPTRAIQAYLTEPLYYEEIIDTRRDPSYFVPMVRAQFSNKYGEAMVQQRADSDSEARVKILDPGLVSVAKADAYVRGDLMRHDVLSRSWIRVVSRPDTEEPQQLTHIGTMQQTPETLRVERGKRRDAAFAKAALTRVLHRR